MKVRLRKIYGSDFFANFHASEILVEHVFIVIRKSVKFSYH